jgi:hypothetical protein
MFNELSPDEFLDEAFVQLETPHTPCAFTPLGNEIVFGTECEEPTVQMTRAELDFLLNETIPSRHKTVQGMKAVVVAAVKRAFK